MPRSGGDFPLPRCGKSPLRKVTIAGNHHRGKITDAGKNYHKDRLLRRRNQLSRSAGITGT
ncbi:hypothetical protein DSM101010T_35650 [Desulfovibrio subterraneus]|uniref:Uncharacterized protein n=1 Tax=Desulfovibrio subterraneus TaxID=2718620 RepID=A0A7J0BNE0_9BACT|nr:hypothetical protein DSM101010T_35650 [Desulfovibrio subterraneus]